MPVVAPKKPVAAAVKPGPVVAKKPALPAKKAPVAPVEETTEETGEEPQDTQGKRVSSMTEEEKAAAIEDLLAELATSEEQADKRKIRARLRALGHRGGLPKKAKEETTEETEAAVEEAPVAPAAKAGGRPVAKRPVAAK